MLQKITERVHRNALVFKNSIARAFADNHGGEHSVGIVVGSLIVTVIAVFALNAFTDIFSNTALPGMQKNINDMFNL